MGVLRVGEVRGENDGREVFGPKEREGGLES